MPVISHNDGAALSEREAVAGSNSDYSHRRPSRVAAFGCLATDTRHHNLTLLDQKKEKINLHHSSALL